MNLLYITNGINGSGGLERVLSIKASHLAEHYDYQVYILCLNNAHKEPFYKFSPKIKMFPISAKGKPWQYYRNYKKGLQNAVDQIKPDIISVCDDGLKAFFIPTILVTNAKIIYERHVSKQIETNPNNSYLRDLINKAKWRIMDKKGNDFDRFVLLTEGSKEEWPRLKNLEVISNPLSFEITGNPKTKRKIVLSVGRITYQKGQDLLLEAWEKVHKSHPDWELHLYGKENLAFLDTRHLPSSVKFFEPVQDIRSKYLESSVYVMSSRFEGFAMVLIEAMACGMPCVSFDCPNGPKEIIYNGKNGFLVNNGDIDGLANKLNKIIREPNRQVEMGQIAKKTVKKFAPENIIKKWDVLFRDLVG